MYYTTAHTCINLFIAFNAHSAYAAVAQPGTAQAWNICETACSRKGIPVQIRAAAFPLLGLQYAEARSQKPQFLIPGRCVLFFGNVFIYPKQNHSMTDHSQKGEHKIVRFFESNDIRYLYREKKIDLPKDTQQYLLLDFYLPDYKVYVNFLSGWEDPKQRPRLLGRIDRCTKYSIPCVFIYPKDLEHLSAVLHKKLAELAAVQHELDEQKKGMRFNNLFAICCMIGGGVFLLFPVTMILGYISLGYGIVLFLLDNHRHLGKGSILFFTYLWLILRAIARGLYWGLLHIGTVLRYVGRALAFLGVHLGKGLKVTGIYLWKGLRLLFFGLYYLIRFLALLLWKYIKIAYKGLELLFIGMSRGVKHGTHTVRTAARQGPGNYLKRIYAEYKRKVQNRMKHRRFGKF